MKAGVVGAGLTGAEIALVFALAGHEVLLHDRSDEALAGAIDRLRGILDLKRRVTAGCAGGRGRPGWLGKNREEKRAGEERGNV